MATQRRNSANATRCRCGRPARPARSMPGPPAVADSSTSMGSSAARRTSGTRRSTRARPRSRSKDARRGLPSHGGHDRQGDRLDRPAEGSHRPTSRSLFTSRPGATHAPHHVPKEWADKYKGKFDQGWDKLREETFARQKKLGVIPPDCRAYQAARGDPVVGRHAGGSEAGAEPPDGGLRRIPGIR